MFQAPPQHQLFTRWAKDQGVQMNKIAPANFDGRGLGIIATEHIKTGDVLAVVPASALVTSSSAPAPLRRSLGKITVHGLLAAVLTLDAASSKPSWQEWRAVWPSEKDFEVAMPLMWDSETREHLPPTCQDHEEIVRKQVAKFNKDFRTVLKAFPAVSRDRYLYHWLIVNTRTFYYAVPGSRVVAPEDRMVLCPFIDYFNHADAGCDVAFGDHGFTVASDRNYEPGEEIYISYGNHSNDFLLAEYGFILSENKWNDVRLDHLILPQLSKLQRDQLRRAGYLRYLLDQEGVCHRTEVALRLLIGPVDAWNRFVAGEDDGESNRMMVKTRMIELLGPFKEAAATASKILADKRPKTPSEDVLERRWVQILQMLHTVMRSSVH